MVADRGRVCGVEQVVVGLGQWLPGDADQQQVDEEQYEQTPGDPLDPAPRLALSALADGGFDGLERAGRAVVLRHELTVALG